MGQPSRQKASRAGAGSNAVNLENVVDNVATTMFVCDENLVVTHVSEATLKALGYSRDEVVGKMTCADMCKTPLCGTANCTIKNCMRTGEQIVGETEATGRDGKKIPIAACCSAIFDDDGNPVGGMELIFDQTDQKNALAEVARLIDATKEGKLDERTDPDKAKGDFKALFEGVNELVDAFVAPINVTAEYVDSISKGQIPEKITDEYKGDFNEIKNNLNACVDVMNNLLQETDTLIQATVEGRLDTRGKAD